MQRRVSGTQDANRDNQRAGWPLARPPKTPPRSAPPPRCRTAGTVHELGKERYDPGRQIPFTSPSEQRLSYKQDVDVGELLPTCPSTPSSIQSVQPARRRSLKFVDDGAGGDEEEKEDESELRRFDSPMPQLDLQHTLESKQENDQTDKAEDEPGEETKDEPEDMVVDTTPPTESTPSPPPPSSSSARSLLSLPVEIRHQVYHLFPETHISTRPLIYGLSPFANRKQHPLSAICRQIRYEALELYYSANTWAIKLEFEMMYDAFLCWLRKVGMYTQHLRVLQISLSTRYLPPVNGRGIVVEDIAAAAGSQPGLWGSPSLWVAPNLVPTPSPPTLPPSQSQFEGQATFEIDLSQKFECGRVRVLRTESDAVSTEAVQALVQSMTARLWQEKNNGGCVTESLMKNMMDFLLDHLETRWYKDRSRPVIS